MTAHGVHPGEMFDSDPTIEAFARDLTDAAAATPAPAVGPALASILAGGLVAPRVDVPAVRRRRPRRLRLVVGSAVFGLGVGSLGVAGALPGPVQEQVSRVADVVGVHLPDGLPEPAPTTVPPLTVPSTVPPARPTVVPSTVPPARAPITENEGESESEDARERVRDGDPGVDDGRGRDSDVGDGSDERANDEPSNEAETRSEVKATEAEDRSSDSGDGGEDSTEVEASDDGDGDHGDRDGLRPAIQKVTGGHDGPDLSPHEA